eukprot:685707-Prorocentrum_minimum.AAC.1
MSGVSFEEAEAAGYKAEISSLQETVKAMHTKHRDDLRVLQQRMHTKHRDDLRVLQQQVRGSRGGLEGVQMYTATICAAFQPSSSRPLAAGKGVYRGSRGGLEGVQMYTATICASSSSG